MNKKHRLIPLRQKTPPLAVGMNGEEDPAKPHVAPRSLGEVGAKWVRSGVWLRRDETLGEKIPRQKQSGGRGGFMLAMAVILGLGLWVRLYRVGTPLGDWHSWRQADTAAVTRRYAQEGIDLLHPRYDDVSSIPSGRENPNGYRMVEFPIINGLTAWLYQKIPGARLLQIHVFSRLVSIAFSLGSLMLLYFIVRMFSSDLEAILAALVFALLPYNIYFSRVVLPEVPLVFFTLASLYFSVRYFSSATHSAASFDFWLAAGSSAIALLLKPYALFLSLPLLYVGWKRCRTHLLTNWKSYVFLGLVFVPFLLWRVWIRQFPEGIPAYTWLLNGNGIRFKGSFFQWLFADRLGRLILGYWGLIPFGLGILVQPKAREGWFYRWWGIGILLYLVVFATGNVQHDYYQVIAIPIISIFVAKGLAYLLRPGKDFSNLISYFLFLISLTFTFAFGWYHVRDYFNINHPEIVQAGRAADAILPGDARVIAPYNGDTAFLYQTDRRGWPIGGSIDEKIKLGATDYISVNFDDETKDLTSRCQVMLKTEKYVIIDLKNCID